MFGELDDLGEVLVHLIVSATQLRAEIAQLPAERPGTRLVVVLVTAGDPVTGPTRRFRPRRNGFRRCRMVLAHPDPAVVIQLEPVVDGVEPLGRMPHAISRRQPELRIVARADSDPPAALAGGAVHPYVVGGVEPEAPVGDSGDPRAAIVETGSQLQHFAFGGMLGGGPAGGFVRRRRAIPVHRFDGRAPLPLGDGVAMVVHRVPDRALQVGSRQSLRIDAEFAGEPLQPMGIDGAAIAEFDGQFGTPLGRRCQPVADRVGDLMVGRQRHAQARGAPVDLQPGCAAVEIAEQITQFASRRGGGAGSIGRASDRLAQNLAPYLVRPQTEIVSARGHACPGANARGAGIRQLPQRLAQGTRHRTMLPLRAVLMPRLARGPFATGRLGRLGLRRDGQGARILLSWCVFGPIVTLRPDAVVRSSTRRRFTTGATIGPTTGRIGCGPRAGFRLGLRSGFCGLRGGIRRALGIRGPKLPFLDPGGLVVPGGAHHLAAQAVQLVQPLLGAVAGCRPLVRTQIVPGDGGLMFGRLVLDPAQDRGLQLTRVAAVGKAEFSCDPAQFAVCGVLLRERGVDRVGLGAFDSRRPLFRTFGLPFRFGWLGRGRVLLRHLGTRLRLVDSVLRLPGLIRRCRCGVVRLPGPRCVLLLRDSGDRRAVAIRLGVRRALLARFPDIRRATLFRRSGLGCGMLGVSRGRVEQRFAGFVAGVDMRTVDIDAACAEAVQHLGTEVLECPRPVGIEGFADENASQRSETVVAPQLARRIRADAHTRQHLPRHRRNIPADDIRVCGLEFAQPVDHPARRSAILDVDHQSVGPGFQRAADLGDRDTGEVLRIVDDLVHDPTHQFRRRIVVGVDVHAEVVLAVGTHTPVVNEPDLIGRRLGVTGHQEAASLIDGHPADALTFRENPEQPAHESLRILDRHVAGTLGVSAVDVEVVVDLGAVVPDLAQERLQIFP
ncbi:Uncharacterised protein [Nocardia africana]|uniref:Uncharacterized protein n=1 Tax=Nocardia africana TaxID=134964 RepID=A0A378WKL4_9NOCA|nr:Uncharacterised protein [Nocardia africana]